MSEMGKGTHFHSKNFIGCVNGCLDFFSKASIWAVRVTPCSHPSPYATWRALLSIFTTNLSVMAGYCSPVAESVKAMWEPAQIIAALCPTLAFKKTAIP